jgi:hypothetical protein
MGDTIRRLTVTGYSSHRPATLFARVSDEGTAAPLAPRMLRLDISKAASRDWVETSVRFAAAELVRGRLASSSVMSRLSEVLLVEAVREYISTLGDREQGWLKGLSDPNIGRALALI